ncbi:ABC transporter permease [Actinoplanes sp. TBRC 11911]|uniref:ABC transporter permease n=1 Tax=Actinoplanes sp. TBRC 11911 TaxID=2729386 RepID=UPI00145EDA96|nr:ABC transporter permease [Actinoplanes sp. TBRC 11911]NMO57019.1 ABC transporter permease [Actinoplanes sp. TBRC 11911]
MSDINAVTTAEAPGPAATRPADASSAKPRSLAGDAWRDLRRSKVFWIAAVLVAVILLMAVWPTLFTSADPANCQLANRHHPAGGGALFGYDFQGCNVYARTIYGARDSIFVAVVATLIAGVIGLTVGLVAGFYGRWADAVLSRFIDIVLGVPFLLAAIVLARRFTVHETDTGVLAVTLTLGLLGWTTAARVMRSAVITARNQDYVTAARMLGAGPGRLMFRHILPNAVGPFLVVLTLLLGINIAAEATLSYLGVGLQGDAISWGTSIAGNGPYVRVVAGPVVWPSIFLAVTVLAFIMLGDAVRDAFDPKRR